MAAGTRFNAWLRVLGGAEAHDRDAHIVHGEHVTAEQLCLLAQLSYGLFAGLAVDPDTAAAHRRRTPEPS